MISDTTWVRIKSRVPLIGGALAYTHDPLTFLQEMYERCGPVGTLRTPGDAMVVVLGPDACGAVLTNGDKAFVEGWHRLVGPFFDRGLMLLDGAEHQRHRRILQMAFTRDRLEAYTAALHPAVARELDTWHAAPRFAAYGRLKELTLNIATQIFMGGHRIEDSGELDGVNQAFVDCVQAAGALLRVAIPGNRWHRATRGRVVLEEFLLRHLPAAHASNGDDLFSVLCRVRDDEGNAFTDRDVVNHMIFLLMAAHDTSTSTISSAMYYLGCHQEWQERARAEIQELGSRPTVRDLSDLPVLDMVIREAQRLAPPVPVLARTTVKDTEIAGHRIPAGIQLAVGLKLSHYLPQYWSHPQRFDPERFSPQRREDKTHRFAWAPFGGGVHKCLGMAFSDIEVRTILAQVLARFSWTVPTGYVPPMNNLSLPFPKDGMPVELRPLATHTTGIAG